MGGSAGADGSTLVVVSIPKAMNHLPRQPRFKEMMTISDGYWGGKRGARESRGSLKFSQCPKLRNKIGMLSRVLGVMTKNRTDR